MRIAVFSDVHGNFQAFSSVLADIKKEKPDLMFCLGDNIGYGPEPQEVVDLVRKKEIPTVLGNHELALLEKEMLDWFNPQARAMMQKTRKLLSSESIAYFPKLPLYLTWKQCRFVHGFPPDSVSTYLFVADPSEILSAMEEYRERLCFVGHTHELELIEVNDDHLIRRPLSQGVFPLASGHRYLINVGSVGQPRDGNNNAKYVLWDEDKDVLEVRYVPYNVEKTADKIISLGFPRYYADRLR